VKGLWVAILAGGKGERIGGGKPWRRVGGRRLIDIAIDTAKAISPKVAVITCDVAALAELPVRLVADRCPGQGPLAAVATALADLPAQQLLIMPVDAPFVPHGVLEALVKAYPEAKAVALQGPRGPEPLLARYSRQALGPALNLLAKGERRLRILLKVLKAPLVSYEQLKRLDPQGLTLVNLNFPEDLARAEHLASQLWPK